MIDLVDAIDSVQKLFKSELFFLSISKILEEACPAVQLSSCPAGARAVSWASSRAAPWHSRSQLGDRPSALARPGWLDLASTGSIWLPLAPLLARSGLDWLDLVAPGALAGLNWSLLVTGRPGWLDLVANEYPNDAISKNK